MDLQRTDAFLRGQHEMQHMKPSTQRQLGFLEDGSGLEREAIRRAIVFAALLALPVPRARRALVNMIVLAAWALGASGPAAQQQVGPARLFVGEQMIELRERHLSREFWFAVLPRLLHNVNNSGLFNGSQLRHTSGTGSVSTTNQFYRLDSTTFGFRPVRARRMGDRTRLGAIFFF